MRPQARSVRAFLRCLYPLLALIALLPLRVAADPASLLVGGYDNHEQVWQEDLDGGARSPHLALRVDPIAVPALGERVLAARYGPLGASEADRSLRLLVPAAGGTALEAYESLRGAAVDFTVAAAADFRRLPNRDLAFRRDGPAWNGSGWRLDAQGLTAPAAWFDAAGETPLKLRRVRRFRGWMGIERRRVDPTAADDDWIFVREFHIHNEGQVVPLTDAGGTRSGYSVQLARLTYQNTKTPILKLGLIEDATGETLVYTWANVGADRIGMNLRWFQVGLTAIADERRSR